MFYNSNKLKESLEFQSLLVEVAIQRHAEKVRERNKSEEEFTYITESDDYNNLLWRASIIKLNLKLLNNDIYLQSVHI